MLAQNWAAMNGVGPPVQLHVAMPEYMRNEGPVWTLGPKISEAPLRLH